MTRSTTDQNLINSLSGTLQEVKLALESALAVTRPDLLDPLPGSSAASQQALQRIGSKGGWGNYLMDTLARVDGEQQALTLAAVENTERTNESTTAINAIIQRWDITAGEQAEYSAFNLVVKQNHAQLEVVISPVNGEPNENMLHVAFEISGERPAMHISGGADEVALSVFSNGKEGVVLREGDAGSLDDMMMAKHFMPAGYEDATDEKAEIDAPTLT